MSWLKIKKSPHPFEIKDLSSLSFFPLTSILGTFKNKSQGREQKKQNKTKTELAFAEVKHSAANITEKLNQLFLF